MSIKHRLARCAIACLVLLPIAMPVAHAAQLQIPTTHPRLWYGNPARLQQARTHFASHPFVPGPNNAFEKALRGVVTGNNADCDAAADYLVGWEARPGMGGFRDDTRQNGEALLLIFDWCFSSLSLQEVNTLVTRWNGYMDRDTADPDGNRYDEANNYWWGRTRNLLLWGIASRGVNTRAQEFIDQALDVRMGLWFPQWYANFGRGGVFPEGGDYGAVSLSYPLIAFASAADFGFDPYARTPYFREAIYALIYGTTPGPSAISGSYAGGSLLFPFNDDENFHNGSVINARTYLGDFARYFGTRNATGNARHTRAWLAQTGARRQWMFDALGGSGLIGDLTPLPLDYYAPGAQVLDARTSHGMDATQVHLQLGTPGGTQHRHIDGGSFQIWRKGRWITRESTGYSNRLVAYGQPSGSAVTMDASAPAAHNALLMEGRSMGVWAGEHTPVFIPPGGSSPNENHPRGLPHVRRLQHEPPFAFAAVDYTAAYRHRVDTRLDWPYTDRIGREFVFIRPLQALIVFDRIRASGDSQRPFYFGPNWFWDGPNVSAAQVRRSFISHFETPPSVTGNRVTATLGDQTSELITMLPLNPTYRIVNEDVPGHELAGQHRLELDHIGAAESYFLNVLTGYDTGEARFTVQLVEDSERFTLRVNHPQRGSATIVLRKGMDSTGGSVSINGGVPIALREDVQGIVVDDEGPHWAGDPIFDDGFDG